MRDKSSPIKIAAINACSRINNWNEVEESLVYCLKNDPDYMVRISALKQLNSDPKSSQDGSTRPGRSTYHAEKIRDIHPEVKSAVLATLRDEAATSLAVAVANVRAKRPAKTSEFASSCMKSRYQSQDLLTILFEGVSDSSDKIQLLTRDLLVNILKHPYQNILDLLRKLGVFTPRTGKSRYNIFLTHEIFSNSSSSTIESYATSCETETSPIYKIERVLAFIIRHNLHWAKKEVDVNVSFFSFCYRTKIFLLFLLASFVGCIYL